MGTYRINVVQKNKNKTSIRRKLLERANVFCVLFFASCINSMKRNPLSGEQHRKSQYRVQCEANIQSQRVKKCTLHAFRLSMSIERTHRAKYANYIYIYVLLKLRTVKETIRCLFVHFKPFLLIPTNKLNLKRRKSFSTYLLSRVSNHRYFLLMSACCLCAKVLKSEENCFTKSTREILLLVVAVTVVSRCINRPAVKKRGT